MKQPGNHPTTSPWRESRAGALSARGGVLLLLGLAVVAGVLIWADPWKWRRTSPKEEGNPPLPPRVLPPGPRVTYDGPFRNVRPDVKYVGDAVCAGCHPLLCETYHEHPMGRSMASVIELAGQQRYDESVNNPFQALGIRFEVKRRGEQVWHSAGRFTPAGEKLAESSSEVHYAIGSGSSGRSYLSVRDGFVFQTPISWFSQAGKWDLSPGFRDAAPRPVIAKCLFCHSNGVRPVEGTVNRYEEPVFTPLTLPSPPGGEGHRGAAVGCERCHGPGELHERERLAQVPLEGYIDYTIVNPAHLSADLRGHVCQQCHLEGKARVLRRGRGPFDYRPGLPLYEFWSIYVLAHPPHNPPPARGGIMGGVGPDEAVSHVEQMHESKCFQASKGKMGCTSCHDPHEYPRPESRVSFYRDRCLNCHQEQSPCVEELAVRQRKEDNCITCHMPRAATADIAHTAATDHRVPRVPGKFVPRRDQQSDPSVVPLVHFHREELGEDHKDADRDLGLALAKWASRIGGPDRDAWIKDALRRLERAEAKDPYDVPVPLRRGHSLALLGKHKNALAAFEKVLKVAPRNETALRGAARMCANLRRFDRSAEYFRRVIEVNPHEAEDRLYLAAALALQGKYREAIEACERAVRIDPLQAGPRVVLAYCYRKLEDYPRSRAEAKKGDALRTPGSEQFRQAFRELTK